MNSVNDLFLIFNNSRVHTIRGFTFPEQKISIPFKLLNFYTAIIMKINNYLVEGEDYKYCYLVIPSTDSDINIRILFNDDNYKNRLLLVSIPNERIGDLSLMIKQIIHEIAHYVCNDSRSRGTRASMIWKSLKSYVYDQIFENNQNDFPVIVDYMKKKNCNATEYLYKEACSYLDEEKRRCANLDKLDKFKKIYPVLIETGLLNFCFECDDIKLEWINYLTSDKVSDYIKRKESIDDCITNIKKKYAVLIGKNEINEQTVFYLKLCDECFSDIVMKNTLNLKLRDFLDTSCEEYYDYIDTVNPDFIIARTAFVLAVSKYDLSDRGVLNNYGFKKEEVMSKALDLAEYIRRVHNLGLKKVFENKDFFIIPDALGTYQSIDYLYRYFKSCEIKLKDADKTEEKEKMKKQIIEIYTISSDDDTEKIINEIEEYTKLVVNDLKFF